MKEFVNDILSSPFGLVLESIVGIVILVVLVLSKTKFGRKLLFALMDRVTNSEKKNRQANWRTQKRQRGNAKATRRNYQKVRTWDG